jgi:hypothetical protein
MNVGREPFTAHWREGFLFISPLLRTYSRSSTPISGVLAAASARRGVRQALGPQSVITSHTGILTRSPLLKPEMVWGCCLPPGCFPAAAPQAFLCIPTGHVLADPKQLKAAGLRVLLTRRALRRPPLSRPRHLGDPRPALVQSSGLLRLEGSQTPDEGFWLSTWTGDWEYIGV